MDSAKIPLKVCTLSVSVLAASFLGKSRRIVLIPALLGCLALGVQAQSAGEYQVKAAFLFNFTKFVAWPSAAFPTIDAPLQICVIGQDPFGREFEQSVAGKNVNGRRIELAHPDTVPQARTCQILFIAASEKQLIHNILRGLEGASVLTVGDTPNFVQMGGVINFVLDQDRVRFEINLKAAELAHLKLSARLLTVAKLVLPGELTGED